MCRRALFPRLAILVTLAFFAAAYVWRPGGTRGLALVSDVICLAAAALAATLAFVASVRFDRSAPQGRAWLLLGAGMAVWTVAELIWMHFEIGVGDEVPYPSLADAVWAVGYAPLILGMYLGYRGLGVRLRSSRRVLVTLAYAVLLAALAFLLLRPMFAGPAPASPAESFIGSFYLVGDLTLAFIASLSLIVAWDGLIGRPWLSITLGTLLFAISDSTFSYADWAGIYAVGGNWQSAMIDMEYLAAYLLVALGAYRQATLRLADIAQPRSTN